MAKKNSKSKKVEPAKKAVQKKKTSTTTWIIGAVVVVVIIIALVLILRGCAKAPVEQPTAPTPSAPKEAPKEKPVSEKPEIVSAAPEEVRYCTITYAIGWPKNKLGTDVCKVDGNEVSAQIMFSGKGKTLSGLWFKITTRDGEVQYLKDERELQNGETKTYTINVGKKIKEMLALPIISVDNVDKACLNQRILVIKDESCVVG